MIKKTTILKKWVQGVRRRLSGMLANAIISFYNTAIYKGKGMEKRPE